MQSLGLQRPQEFCPCSGLWLEILEPTHGQLWKGDLKLQGREEKNEIMNNYFGMYFGG